MHGPTERLIRQRGESYTVRNATDSGGDRTTPSYSDDGSITGVLERRSRPAVESLPSGGEIETELELRVIEDGSTPTLREAVAADYPSKLVHPNGRTYRVLATYPEDSGVTVLTLERGG